MSDVAERFREGDVFRWHYLDPDTDGRSWGAYHCCSRIGIFHSGRLRDTYWQISTSFSDCRSFAVEDLPKLKLEYLGNLADYDVAPEYQSAYYADADIMDLNHSNHPRGNFYLRKGAKRCAEKMLATARERLEKSESAERTAAWKSEELRKAIAKIEAGEIDAHLF
jgi:hypothetical protein